MNKSKNSPSTVSEKALLKEFWIWINGLHKIVQEKKDLNYLNEYRSALSLWVQHTNDTKQKIIVTLDWRDTAGKWSNIKRVTENFDPKRYDIKAYWVPSFEERFEYNHFKKYMNDFPEEWNLTFFDRSWYNRAWVEAAMGFCTQEEYDWFMDNVEQFEREQIIDEGIKFIKVYLSITKNTQKERLKTRENIRKKWKSSPVDKMAQEKWNFYTLAKYKILEYTNSHHSPWIVLDSNEKFLSSVEIIKAIINTTDEVAKMVEQDLSIDLSPNPDIRRDAHQEIELMKTTENFEKMKSEFQFRKPTDEEIQKINEYRNNHEFDKKTYSYK